MHYANMPNFIAYVIYCNFFSDSCENDNFQMMKSRDKNELRNTVKQICDIIQIRITILVKTE